MADDDDGEEEEKKASYTTLVGFGLAGAVTTVDSMKLYHQVDKHADLIKREDCIWFTHAIHDGLVALFQQNERFMAELEQIIKAFAGLDVYDLGTGAVQSGHQQRTQARFEGLAQCVVGKLGQLAWQPWSCSCHRARDVEEEITQHQRGREVGAGL